ncbi:MAG: xanthine dehydrogenase family protein molybdopterin-binding subunit [Deltaproteobacteria bacterium]
MGKYIGESVLRKEDPRLVTGEAKYLEDIQLSGMVHAVVKRSDYAHAKIKNIDTSEAEKVPGVIGVWTGKDFEDVNPMPCAWQAGGVDNNANTPRVLEIDKVTFTGQGVAVVVAEDRNIAEDASSKIVVDYEELPTVVSAEEAIKPGAPQLHENAPNNICMEWECGNQEGTEKALGEADVVVKEQLVNQRLIPSSMEPRGAIADYQPATEEFTVWMTSQAPHVHRLLATAFVFGIPETKMRVIAAHVGGGFGCKIFLYPEYCLVAALARKIERPVKWMETRSENFAATTHGRDHVTQIEVGAKNDGTINSLKVTTVANLGGTLSTIAPGIPTTLYGRLLSGTYKFPNIYCGVKGVYTNTGMVDAYRGAGRPEATYVVERALDLVANKLGMDVLDVRRKNFIQTNQFPYLPADGITKGLTYDSGDYEKPLNKALQMFNYGNFREEQKRARDEGKYLGVGFSTYIEACGVAPSAWIGVGGEGWGAGLWESANIRVHLTGKVVVTTGSSPHGQGTETTMAQIAADELGIPYEDVEVKYNDTLGTPFGYGTYGSRSAAVGGAALFNAVQKVKQKAVRIGAHMLEASPDDVVFDDGKVSVKGSPDQAKTIQEIAGAAALGYSLPEGDEPFRDSPAYIDTPITRCPFSTQLCDVELEKETG